VEKTNLNSGSTFAKTEKKSFQQEIKSHNEALEFILNPDRNEIVTFPVEEDFDGEIAVYNATGDLVFKQVVNHGKPNQWDGMMQTGGLAPSGQYGFVIKPKEGTEIKQGFVTVVR
ncbi:MAG: gliding motility-associated C-terminal domain-containing protein, partial [Opitutaceae bacterium]|nr:gliding motility-associated C-terminal domain-containing protein [Cytophagales bacterium]